MPFNSVLATNHGVKQTKASNISKQLLKDFERENLVTFLIKFKQEPDMESAVAKASSKIKGNISAEQATLTKRVALLNELKGTAKRSQKDVLTYLEKEAEKGNAKDIRTFHIVNGLSVTATLDVAKKVSGFREVDKVLPNKKHSAPPLEQSKGSVAASTGTVESNIDKIEAPAVWDKHINGKGVVIATIDSGVDWDHPALKEKYRGYNKKTGKVNHEYNWFDATFANKSKPYDDVGHGTHVTGTIVGSEKNKNNQIGVAPGATWIAVKAFDALGATDVDLLEAAQWILAPTDSKGNERPDLSPDIVNNSWSSGIGFDEWYRDIVKAWITADIFPMFAAGNVHLYNSGGPGSIENPANYPESFAVGSITKNDKVASTSLRGPSPYGEIKPDVVAQGVGIRSSLPGGGYGYMSGTSMATPAVSGVVALMKQAAPHLDVEQIKEILRDTSIPLKDEEYSSYPNNGYGYGLVNANQAVEAAIAKENQKLQRLSGYLRYDTAIRVSQSGWSTADTVILARGDNFADALAGAPLAYKLDAPIILTSSKKLYEPALREIKRLRASKVIVLGGPAAINEKIINTLENENVSVRRIAGNLRFDTAAKIASEVSTSTTKSVAITNGMDFPDALSVASYAAQTGMPILLTNGDKIPKATETTIKKLQVQQSVVIGGPSVLSEHVVKKLPRPIRLSGSDRYETNVEIANHYKLETKQMFVATGRNYADALTGAVLAAKKGTGILLVHDKVPKSVANYITNQQLEQLTLLGGPVAIKKTVESDLYQLIKE